MITPEVDSITNRVGSDIYVGAKSWFEKLDVGHKKSADYRDGLNHRLGCIQVMGMAEPKKLKTIYVGIRVCENFRKYRGGDIGFSSEKKMDILGKVMSFENFRSKAEVEGIIKSLGYKNLSGASSEDDEDDGMGQSTIMPQYGDADDDDLGGKPTDVDEVAYHGVEVLELINRNDRLVVLGQPGCGKTTLMKYLALAFSGFVPVLSGTAPALPIYIPLRDLERVGACDGTADWLMGFILNCASDYSDKKTVRPWLTDQLYKKNCIVLLDGLDEVPPSVLPNMLKSMSAFSTKFKGNRFVVTCRSAAYGRRLEGFKVCEIDDFNDGDRRKFARQWFGEKLNDYAQLMDDLEASSVAMDLCKTPLLMTMICIQYGIKRTIPKNRAELYESCIDALMYSWDTYRSIERPSLTGGLSINKKKMILSKIARITFDRQQYHFQKKNLISFLDTELKRVSLQSVSAPLLLEELESHNGILMEYQWNVYGFSHLTFHEFLTAIAYQEEHDLEELFSKAVSDRRYREVFLMVVERLYSPDSIILNLVSWAKQKCVDEGDYDDNIALLLGSLLKCQIYINPKIRMLCIAVLSDMKKIEHGAQTVFDRGKLGQHFNYGVANISEPEGDMEDPSQEGDPKDRG